MKTGEAAKILGIDVATIRRWIEREEINRFFSESARSGRDSTQRILTDGDILVLNTVLALRTHKKVTDWSEIVSYLNSGQREQDFPQNAITADPRTVPLPQAEQSARAMATLAERDAALRRVNDLEKELRESREENKQLLREMMELSQKIGRLEGLIEAEKNRRTD